MKTKIPEGAPAYFQTLKRTKYRFRNEEQKKRFIRCCCSESTALYHFEVLDMLAILGVEGWSKFREIEPRSVYRPELLYPSCAKWDKRRTFNPNRVALAKAIAKVEEDFSVLNDSVTPISLEEATTRMAFRPDGQRKSAGLPYLRKKDEVVSETMARAKHVLRGKAPEPCLGIHRGKKRNEARLVWAYPYEMAAIESMFQSPLMERLMHTNGVHPIVYLTGNRIQNHARIDRARLNADYVVCLDYSAYDSSLGSQLLTFAWKIMKRWFKWIDEKAWRRIESYFATSPILMPDGYVYSGRKAGVPSGSNFTQLVDSIVNAIAIRYIEQRIALTVTNYGVLGDDSYIGVRLQPSARDGVDLNSIKGVLEELGIHLNVKKSHVRSSNAAFHFLGVHWYPQHTVSRPLSELLERIVCPERWSVKPTIFTEEGRYTEEYINWFSARVQSYMIEAGPNIHALQALINFPRRWNLYSIGDATELFDWKSWWHYSHDGFCRAVSNAIESEQIMPGYVDRAADYMPSDQKVHAGKQLRCVAK